MWSARKIAGATASSGQLVCLGNIMLSLALMHRCADDGISLVLLNNQGRFKARLKARYLQYPATAGAAPLGIG